MKKYIDKVLIKSFNKGFSFLFKLTDDTLLAPLVCLLFSKSQTFFFRYQVNLGNEQITRFIYENDIERFTKNYKNFNAVLNIYKHSNKYYVDKSLLVDSYTLHPFYEKDFDYIEVVDIYNWCKYDKGKLVNLKPKSIFKFDYPKVINEFYENKQYELLEPESFIAKLNNILVVEDAGIMAKRNDKLFWITYEPQAHPKHKFVASYWKQFIHYNEQRQKVLVPRKNKIERKIQKAILIDGRCSENYFHFLLEYLSRFYALQIQTSFDLNDVPILVADDMPYQHYEALHMFVKDRKIIYLSENVEVEELYVLSIPTLHYDDISIPFLDGASIDVKYFEFLREIILSSLEYQSTKNKKYPTKIFLSRKTGNRSIQNRNEVERFFTKKGFDIVYPENLSFIEQVAFFANAEVIAGANGAALTNLIFAKSTAKIYILINAYNKEFNWHYNLAKYVSKCSEVYHVVGKSMGSVKKSKYPYKIKMEKVLQPYLIKTKDLELIDA